MVSLRMLGCSEKELSKAGVTLGSWHLGQRFEDWDSVMCLGICQCT